MTWSHQDWVWKLERDAFAPTTPEQKTSPATQKAVLLALAFHANKDASETYPSIETLSKETLLSDRGVQNAIKALVRAGLLLPTEKKFHRANVYRMPPQSIPSKDANPEPRSPLVRAQPRTSGSPTPNVTPSEPRTSAPGWGNDVHPNLKRNLEENLKDEPEEGSRPFSEQGGPDNEGEPPPDLVDQARDLWNAHAGENRQIQLLTPERQKLIRSRLRDYFSDDLGQWSRFCRRIAQARWLNGGKNGDWYPGLEWCLKPEKLMGILEGNYPAAERHDPDRGVSL